MSERFGAFRVLSPLGSGTMSVTDVAERTGPAGVVQRVCLKRLRSVEANDPRWIAMFQTEARVAASLHHQNIVSLFDFGRDDGEPPTWWMALELIEGTDLRPLLARGERMPVELALFVVSEIAKALAYAHARVGDDGEPLHLVHRDVSTGNILVGRDGAVMLTDFGIAKVTHGARTRTGDIKGKAPYIAPEISMGQSFDGRADVFSLGVVLFEMLAGRLPFTGPTPYAAQLAAVKGVRPRLESLAPETPPTVIALVDRMLTAEPGERPTADELIDLASADLVGNVARRLAAFVSATLLLLGCLVGCGISTTPIPTGEPCTTDADCPASEACLRTHPGEIDVPRCRPICPPQAGLCNDGSVCESRWGDDPRTDWVCWPGGAGAYGEPCATDFECARGLYCSTDGSAADPPFCVDACSSTADCPLGFYCHEWTDYHRTCSRRRNAGDACGAGAACINGVCENLESRGHQCSETCPAGQACDLMLVIGSMRCRDYDQIGCLGTACPEGQVCFERCVPSHE